MRQILSRRELRADRWRYPGEGGTGPLVQTLPELLAAAAAAGQSPETSSSLGVRLGPTDDVELLVPWLARVVLVVVHFETGGDGRGYSQAQLLRGRFGYQGELRAAGA
ncbi:MAG: DUF934 domain-containing protein, partial [Proteobacteria bacterium]|nr:DUF934 domain-containing protein [Pseudomonadota bacterium]